MPSRFPLPTTFISPKSLSAFGTVFPQQSLAKMFGMLGILIAFGHSVLAMSGEESLAQVNRELAHPKLKNLKRAAIVIAHLQLRFHRPRPRCCRSC